MLKRDKNAPVLYELIRNRQGSPPSTSAADDQQPDEKTSPRAGDSNGSATKTKKAPPAKRPPPEPEYEAEEEELEDGYEYEEVDVLDEDEDDEEYAEAEDGVEYEYEEEEDEDEDDPEPALEASEADVEYDDDDEDPATLTKLSPGQAVRIPVGYVGIGLAIAAIVVVGAYVAGYKKRESLADAERRAEAERLLDQTADPLVALSPGSAAAAETTAPVTRTPARASNPAPQPRKLLHIVTAPGDDPRQEGLNYLVVATLPTDEARKAGEFLVSRGLEIALVSINNRSSRQEVVVLQGLTREQFRQAQGTQLEQLVSQLGREYRRDHRGIEFYDVYWKKYTTG